MSDRFTKVFESILDSTIWFEDSDTRCVWLTLMALADADGMVENTMPGLAHRAFPKLPLEEAIPITERALAKFQEPDEYSRTKDHEGRRIAVVDGGWFLINHHIYREKRKAEDRKEQNRRAQEKWRKAQKDKTVSADISTDKQSKPKPSASSSASASETKEVNPVFVDHKDVGAEFATRRKAAGGQGFRVGTGYYTLTSEAIDWARDENPAEPITAIRKSMDNYFASDWSKSASYPYNAWAKDPGSWGPPNKGNGKKGVQTDGAAYQELADPEKDPEPDA